MVTSFRRSGVSWDRIASANERANLLSDELLEIARDCGASSPDYSRPTQDMDRILRTSTVNLLYDSWFEGVGSSPFRYCLHKPTEWKHIELPGQSMFDIQTHRDHMRMFPEYDASEFEPGWMVGKLSAVTVSLLETEQWNEELGEPHRLVRRNSDPDRAWEVGSRIVRDLPSIDFTGPEFGLNRPRRLPARVLPSLSAQVSLADPAERLTALLGRRPILIGSRDAWSTRHIETIVSGLACTLPEGQPIDILRIAHGSEPNNVNPVSLAVLMPLITAMSDSSEWWVFDRVHRAKGLELNECQWVDRFNAIAEQMGTYINWIALSGVSVKYLLSLCDYRSFQRLRSQFEDLEGMAGKIRGVDDQDLYTIVITTYIPPRQVGDGPWTPWYADYYHPAV